ncbi:hypothetical protein L226DRAFT_77516 [Lentinus tigrinus ALCF2SS1-7]|uniref:uncharacterized protein n=1 Tax=Lentinus tigrinus ALCF2SS1-7 TaxID=1328758 RepID=UPI001165DDF0|nr:hypothetical protein L226DRAFT_77516 [Lentinus tigrinus ALCF2SS1-7]
MTRTRHDRCPRSPLPSLWRPGGAIHIHSRAIAFRYYLRCACGVLVRAATFVPAARCTTHRHRRSLHFRARTGRSAFCRTGTSVHPFIQSILSIRAIQSVVPLLSRCGQDTSLGYTVTLIDRGGALFAKSAGGHALDPDTGT